MIYTQAVVLEVHRFGIVLPHYIPRGALKDIRYKNYVIKKVKRKRVEESFSNIMSMIGN